MSAEANANWIDPERLIRRQPTWLRLVNVCAVALTAAAAVVGCAPTIARSTTAPAAMAAAPAREVVALPNASGSLKFAVLGDFGTGERAQYNLADRMAMVHERFPFELTMLVGDNIYGSARPQDYERKFAVPYKPLLDAGVKFYASLGNHDPREQRYYEPFNMKGEFYYSVKAPKQDVRLIALDTTYFEPAQLKWLENTLASAREAWKIVFFHHPLYSSGGTHGSDDRLREQIEPLLVKYGVSLVLTGHDHIYERIQPQQGITYFVTGSGGKLRPGDARKAKAFSAKVVDDVNVFAVMEINGDTLDFNAIATDGRIVDSGQVTRRREQPAAPSRTSTRP